LSAATDVFRRPVREHMGAAPLVLPAATPVAELVLRMAQLARSAVVLEDGAGRPVGIVTEQDVVRRAAFRLDATTPAHAIASAPVLTLRDDDLLYRAIGFMRRARLRHMPALDSAGRVTGILDLQEALAAASGRLVGEIDALTHEDTLDGLARVKAAQARVARDLMDEGVAAPEIQSLLADINNDIYRRVLRLTLAELEGEGRGPPPAAFECLVMGSGGRGESLLFPDQDNGFVIEGYPDEDHTRIDGWFIELGSRMVARLDTVGIPLCRGGVMATNPAWRKRAAEWEEQIAIWVHRRRPAMLLAADILLDFRCVHGAGALSARLRDVLTERVRASRPFLAAVFGIQADHEAGIGWFGRFVTERRDPTHRGEINLKLWGTLPLAEAVRLLAMRHGVPAAGTLVRLERLRSLTVLDTNEAERLGRAFVTLTRLQLRQQLEDFEKGRAIGNFVDPAALSEHEHEQLRDAFRAINTLRKRLELDLGGSGGW